MVFRSLSGICQALLHLIALAFAFASIYFFFGPQIELIMIALMTFGAAVAFEVIAAIVGDFTTGHPSN